MGEGWPGGRRGRFAALLGVPRKAPSLAGLCRRISRGWASIAEMLPQIPGRALGAWDA
jgi:hypothetical protein